MNLLRNTFQQLIPLRSFPLRAFATSTSQAANETLQVNVLPRAELELELDKLYKRVELEIKGNDPAVLKSYAWFTTKAASHLGLEIGKNSAIRKAIKERYTMYKSVHIFKRHKVQYEVRTYYRFIHLHRLTGSTTDTFLEYIERNLPEGVAMKVTKVELNKLPEYINEPPETGESEKES